MTERAIKVKPAFDQIGDSRCTGCAACVNACERNALVMTLNASGFYRPLVNRAQCANCGVCATKCPVLAEEQDCLPMATWPQPKAFAAWSYDENVRLASTSGGVFTEIAKLFIKRGGVVMGCGWSSDWTPKHASARTEEALAMFRGSKYVQSSVRDALSETIHLSRNGVPVLFSGTPCQIAAAKQLDMHGQKHLVTCEVVCHGVTSVRFFQLYLDQLFSGKSIREFTFRYKPLGWEVSHIRACSVYGGVYESNWSSDPWAQLAMGYHLALMPSCFNCVFQRKHRIADITLGDFWGVPKNIYDSKGISVVLVNSPSGEELFSTALQAGAIKATPVEWDVAVRHNARATSANWSLPQHYQSFSRDVSLGHTFRYLKWKYYIPFRVSTRIVGLSIALLSKVIPQRVKLAVRRRWRKN